MCFSFSSHFFPLGIRDPVPLSSLDTGGVFVYNQNESKTKISIFSSCDHSGPVYLILTFHEYYNLYRFFLFVVPCGSTTKSILLYILHRDLRFVLFLLKNPYVCHPSCGLFVVSFSSVYQSHSIRLVLL